MGRTDFFILGPFHQYSNFDGICVSIVEGNMKISNGILFIIPTILFNGIFLWRMWHFVASQFGLLIDIHLIFGLDVVFPLMEAMQSFLKFSQRRVAFICDFITIMKVCQGQLYNLYCDNNSSFQGDKL
jgi:hypothetical protein